MRRYLCTRGTRCANGDDRCRAPPPREDDCRVTRAACSTITHRRCRAGPRREWLSCASTNAPALATRVGARAGPHRFARPPGVAPSWGNADGTLRAAALKIFETSEGMPSPCPPRARGSFATRHTGGGRGARTGCWLAFLGPGAYPRRRHRGTVLTTGLRLGSRPFPAEVRRTPVARGSRRTAPPPGTPAGCRARWRVEARVRDLCCRDG
jgi:hypothetical protein